jgi:hypothetical protein
MLFHRTHPNRVEAAYDARPPTMRGSLATDSAAYATALFGEPVRTTGLTTSSVTFIDLAKSADGTARVEWIRGGVFTKVRFNTAVRYAVMASTATSGTQLSSTSGWPAAAGDKVEFVADDNYRYLAVLSTDTSADGVDFYRSELPGHAIATSES